jgi:hypothetical protein
MRLLGFNFTKISAERFSSNLENLKISTKIDINNISEAKQDILKIKDEMLSVSFIYEIDYVEKIAKINLEGNLVLSLDSKTYKEVLKQWKDKQIPEDFRIILFNLIIKKSSLNALSVEEDLNLPFHIPLPQIKKQDPSSN